MTLIMTSGKTIVASSDGQGVFYRVNLNTTRGGLQSIADLAFRNSECRRTIKFFLSPADSAVPISDSMVPDFLVTDSMIHRYLSIEPPQFRIISEFDAIIDEIERNYVVGRFFSALSASVVTIERLLNKARIELHQHVSPKIKSLWGKGPSNAWDENIDALLQWKYIDNNLAGELRNLFQIRCEYLHSGLINNLRTDALEGVRGAYALLKALIGFPAHLFTITGGTRNGISCHDTADPLFQVFYAPSLTNSSQ